MKKVNGWLVKLILHVLSPHNQNAPISLFINLHMIFPSMVPFPVGNDFFYCITNREQIVLHLKLHFCFHITGSTSWSSYNLLLSHRCIWATQYGLYGPTRALGNWNFLYWLQGFFRCGFQGQILHRSKSFCNMFILSRWHGMDEEYSCS